MPPSVLYGKSDDLHVNHPQYSIRMARFRGIKRLADVSDNRPYGGQAFDLLRRSEQFLLDHVPIPGRVVPGKMIREDHPWHPSRATREAIANAVCHRDYTIPGGAVAVEVDVHGSALAGSNAVYQIERPYGVRVRAEGAWELDRKREWPPRALAAGRSGMGPQPSLPLPAPKSVVALTLEQS